MQKNLMRRSLGTLITSTTLGIVTLLPGAGANAANCYAYAVNIQGVAAIPGSSQNFSVQQYLVWRDKGAKNNSLEFWFVPDSSNLNASAQVGQIILMTNSLFANNFGIASARIDLAAVSVSPDNVVQFQLDSGASLQLPSPNVFVAPGQGSTPGGLGGIGFLPGAGADIARIINGAQVLSVSYFIPREGGAIFSLGNDGATINGRINVVGSIPDNLSFQGQYQANFSGNYAGVFTCD